MDAKDINDVEPIRNKLRDLAKAFRCHTGAWRKWHRHLTWVSNPQQGTGSDLNDDELDANKSALMEQQAYGLAIIISWLLNESTLLPSEKELLLSDDTKSVQLRKYFVIIYAARALHILAELGKPLEYVNDAKPRICAENATQSRTKLIANGYKALSDIYKSGAQDVPAMWHISRKLTTSLVDQVQNVEGHQKRLLAFGAKDLSWAESSLRTKMRYLLGDPTKLPVDDVGFAPEWVEVL